MNKTQKLLISFYRKETLMACSILLIVIIVTSLLPKYALYGIIFDILVFSKYLYDRRRKLKNDLKEFNY